MISRFIVGVIIAAILTLVGVDDMFIKACHEMLKADVTTTSYYLVFGIIGMLTLR
jgi:hypothetical protein